MKAILFFLALALAINVTSVQAADNVYVVKGITAGGVLNIRANAGAANSIVGRIPHDGQGIVATGKEKKVGSAVWVQISWNNVEGWVSKRYLAPEDRRSTHKFSCSGAEPFWNIEITATTLKVKMMDTPQYSVPITFRKASANNYNIALIGGATAAGKNKTQAFIQPGCNDSMIDNSLPYSITAELRDGSVVSGCCEVRH